MAQLARINAERTAAQRAPGFSPAGPQFVCAARRTQHRRRGFTMIELMVAIAIILILVSLAIVGTRAAQGFARKSNAQQQLKILSNAIDQYAGFWQRWQVGNVVVADKGWPDFAPGRLFDTAVFVSVPGFNDHLTFNNNQVDNYPYPANGPSGVWYDPASGDMQMDEGDVEFAGECLVYALTSASGKGPYIKDEMQGDLLSYHADEFYPTMNAGAEAKSRGEFVDPWGTPFRYFWVYADDTTGTGRAYKGFLPVDFAYKQPTALGSVNIAQFTTPSGKYKTAVGYVLESAGPDKRFGNVWKANPSSQEIADAADNLSVTP